MVEVGGAVLATTGSKVATVEMGGAAVTIVEVEGL